MSPLELLSHPFECCPLKSQGENSSPPFKPAPPLLSIHGTSSTQLRGADAQSAFFFLYHPPPASHQSDCPSMVSFQASFPHPTSTCGFSPSLAIMALATSLIPVVPALSHATDYAQLLPSTHKLKVGRSQRIHLVLLPLSCMICR